MSDHADKMAVAVVGAWLNEIEDTLPGSAQTQIEKRIAIALRAYAEEATRQIHRENEWYRAAHMLLAGDEAFAHNDETSPFFISAEVTTDGKAALALNMNDVFAWACADAEPFTYEDAPTLLNIAVEEGWPGLVRWACKKRGASPQNPVLKNMAQYDAKIRRLVEEEREACAIIAEYHHRGHPVEEHPPDCEGECDVMIVAASIRARGERK